MSSIDQSVMLGGDASSDGGKFQDIKLQASNPFAVEVRQKIKSTQSSADYIIKRAEDGLGVLREQTLQAMTKI